MPLCLHPHVVLVHIVLTQIKIMHIGKTILANWKKKPFPNNFLA